MKSTSSRSRTTWGWPSATTPTSCSRSRGAVATSTSPCTRTTAQPSRSLHLHARGPSRPNLPERPRITPLELQPCDLRPSGRTLVGVPWPSSPSHLDDLAGVAELAEVLARPRRGPRPRAPRRRRRRAPASARAGSSTSRSCPARPAALRELARPLPAAVADRLPGRSGRTRPRRSTSPGAGRSVVVASGTASGKSRCYQVPIAEAAAAPIRPGTGLVPLPHQGAGPRPAPRPHRPRPPRRRRRAPTTATPAPRSARGSASTRRSCSPTPRCCTPACCRTTSAGRRSSAGCATSWSTSSTPSAACSAATSPSCCAGCGGSPSTTAPIRSSSAARPPSASPSGWPRPLTRRRRRRRCSTTARRAARARSRSGSRRCSTPAPGARASAHRETAAVWPGLIDGGHTTLGFARSRRGVEIVAADVRRRLPRPLARRVRAYRGGYLAEERRAIEDELFAGQLAGVVATSALELGIDVGGLDAVVDRRLPRHDRLVLAAGRPGRAARAAPSAAVLVAGNDQLDQWLAAHPDELLARPPEPAVVNPANPFVLDPHLRCAAHELPLTHADQRWWPGVLDDGVRRLVHADELAVRHRGRRQEPIAVWVGRGLAVARRRAAQRRSARRCGSSPPTGSGRSATSTGPGPPSRCTPARPTSTRASTGGSSSSTSTPGVARVEPDDGATYTVARARHAGPPARGRRRARGRAAPASTSARVEVHATVVGLPAQGRAHRRGRAARGRSTCPTATLVTRADLVRRRAGAGRGGRARAGRGCPGALHAIEHAAIGMLPAVRDLRPLGRRRRVHGPPGRHRPPDDRRSTTPCPAGRGWPSSATRPPTATCAATLESIEACPCARGLPVVRPVAEVRQRQRAPRQGRRPRPAPRAPRALATAP